MDVAWLDMGQGHPGGRPGCYHMCYHSRVQWLQPGQPQKPLISLDFLDGSKGYLRRGLAFGLALVTWTMDI